MTEIEFYSDNTDLDIPVAGVCVACGFQADLCICCGQCCRCSARSADDDLCDACAVACVGWEPDYEGMAADRRS